MGERGFAWKVIGYLAVGLIVAFPLTAGVIALEHQRNPPSCTGIGFGCELGPWETAFLMVLLFYAPGVAVLALLIGLLSLGGERLAMARSVVAVVGAVLLVGWYLTFAVPTLT